MDPPEWNIFRRILNPLFAPPAIERMKPELLEFTTRSLDKRIESGTIDFVLDLANPVPAQAVLAFLGLPLEDWEHYAEPAHEVVYTRPGTPEFTKAVEGQAWMFEAVAQAVADRRANPRDDNLSSIITTKIEGRTLGDEEIVSLLGTIINGGVDTTTSLIANALEYLDSHRDVRARLVDHPELIPGATEEFLRYFSPVQAFARTVAQDTDLDGQQLERGDRVLMCFGSANRDEAEFPDADTFVVDREPNRHVAFGLGKHRCIGSTLARGRVRDRARAGLAAHARLRDRSRREQAVSVGRHRERLHQDAGPVLTGSAHRERVELSAARSGLRDGQASRASSLAGLRLRRARRRALAGVFG